MSLPASRLPAPYRFGWAEIVLSTLAVLALTALVFFMLNLACTILAIGMLGLDEINGLQGALKDPARRSPPPRSARCAGPGVY